MKTFDFMQSAISHNLKDPHSKALEPDCLAPPLAIMAQSLRGEGWLYCFKSEGWLFLHALNSSEFTDLKTEMASRTEARFNSRNSFSLLPICRHRHVSLDRMERDGWTAQVNTALTTNTFRGIDLERLIILLKGSPEKDAGAFADDERGIVLV